MATTPSGHFVWTSDYLPFSHAAPSMSLRKILLIDADEDSLVVYSAIFRQRGYKVLVAREVDAAVRIATEEAPDVIVTDLFAQSSTGWQPVERLRPLTEANGVPLIALTARVLEEDRARALKSGCTHFLTKPLQPSELAAFTDALLSGNPADREITQPKR